MDRCVSWTEFLEAAWLPQDSIEGELLNEIAARSDSFFEAAQSLQELQLSLDETLEHISDLQMRMAQVDKGMCIKAAAVRKLHVRRSNLKDISHIVQVGTLCVACWNIAQTPVSAECWLRLCFAKFWLCQTCSTQ